MTRMMSGLTVMGLLGLGACTSAQQNGYSGYESPAYAGGWQQQVYAGCQSIAVSSATASVTAAINSRNNVQDPMNKTILYGVLGAAAGYYIADAPITGARLGIMYADATSSSQDQRLPPLTEAEQQNIYSKSYYSSYEKCVASEVARLQRPPSPTHSYGYQPSRYRYRTNFY